MSTTERRSVSIALFQKLAGIRWVTERQNLIIEGPTSVGKSWLACALGQKPAVTTTRNSTSASRACSPTSLLPRRWPSRQADARAGGVDLLILDDWGLETLNAEQRRDLLEIVEERYSRGAILITSQMPVDRWHDVIGDPTLADAILDRLVHNAHRIQLKGESMRRKKAQEHAMA